MRNDHDIQSEGKSKNDDGTNSNGVDENEGSDAETTGKIHSRNVTNEETPIFLDAPMIGNENKNGDMAGEYNDVEVGSAVARIPRDFQSPPSVEAHRGWNRPVLTPEDVYRHREVFHVAFPKRCLTTVLNRLQRLFRDLSFEVRYNDSPITARCETMEMTELVVTMNQSRDDLNRSPSVILEIHLGGTAGIGAHSAVIYARYILDAASAADSSETTAIDRHASDMTWLSTDLQTMSLRPRRGFLTGPPPPHSTPLSSSSRAEMEQVEALVRKTYLDNVDRKSREDEKEDKEQRPGRAEDGVAPKKKGRSYEEVLNDAVVDAIHNASGLMAQKNLQDQRRLGLESVFHMTDPGKSGLSTAEAVSDVVLLGRAPVDKSNPSDTASECNDIRNMILVLAVRGRWQGDDEGKAARERESTLRMMMDIMGTAEVESLERTDHHDRYLAMMCVANALDVLGISERSREERIGAVLTFVSDTRHVTGLDLIETMMGIIRSGADPSTRIPRHLMYHATKIMVSLFSAVPASVRYDMMIAAFTNNDNKSHDHASRAVSVLEEARRVVGCCSVMNRQHAALEDATGKLLFHLSTG